MDRECSIWLKRRGTLKEGDQQFGSWLKAFTLNLSRKIVVRVVGFKDEDSGDQGRKITMILRWGVTREKRK